MHAALPIASPQAPPITAPAETRSPAAAAPENITRLTQGLAAGDESAFGAFHAAYFDRLLRYHLVLARGDETAARDALQETFLRVARSARRFDDPAVFWSWLTVLARSAACDGGRKRFRYARLLAAYARSLLPFQPAPPPAPAPPGDLESALNTSLAQLEPLDRALLEDKYLRRACVRDLATRSGLSEKAVESRLHRARRDLRARLLKVLRDEHTL